MESNQEQREHHRRGASTWTDHPTTVSGEEQEQPDSDDRCNDCTENDCDCDSIIQQRPSQQEILRANLVAFENDLLETAQELLRKEASILTLARTSSHQQMEENVKRMVATAPFPLQTQQEDSTTTSSTDSVPLPPPLPPTSLVRQSRRDTIPQTQPGAVAVVPTRYADDDSTTTTTTSNNNEAPPPPDLPEATAVRASLVAQEEESQQQLEELQRQMEAKQAEMAALKRKLAQMEQLERELNHLRSAAAAATADSTTATAVVVVAEPIITINDNDPENVPKHKNANSTTVRRPKGMSRAEFHAYQILLGEKPVVPEVNDNDNNKSRRKTILSSRKKQNNGNANNDSSQNSTSHRRGSTACATTPGPTTQQRQQAGLLIDHSNNCNTACTTTTSSSQASIFNEPHYNAHTNNHHHCGSSNNQGTATATAAWAVHKTLISDGQNNTGPNHTSSQVHVSAGADNTAAVCCCCPIL